MGRLLVTLLALCCVAAFCVDLSSAACPTNYVEIAGGCFHFFDNIDNDFLNAREICTSIDGDLAKLNDCDTLGAVADYIVANGLEVEEGYWIGGTDSLEEGVWQWLDGSNMPMGAPYWGRTADAASEPDGSTESNCVFMETGDGYYFHDEDCELQLSPLCQAPTSGGMCTGNYEYILGSCFQFLGALEENFQDSRTICQASVGDLAIINDCDIMQAVISHIYANTTGAPNGFWIGGTDEETEGVWVWVNGAPMSMGVPFWGQAGAGELQPDDTTASQNCAELWARDRYLFNDVECTPTAGRSPLCQADPI